MNLRLALLMFLFSSQVFAQSKGVFVKLEQKNKSPVTSQCKSEIYYTSDYVRINSLCSDHSSSTMFDKKAKKQIQISHNQKKYTEVDEAALAKAGGDPKELEKAQREQVARLRENLSKIPAVQRKLTERNLNKSPIEIKKKGGLQKHKKWSCQTYERYQGKEKLSEFCFATWNELKVNPSDFLESLKASREFRNLYQSKTPFGAPAEEKGLDRSTGLVLKEKVFLDSKIIQELEVTDIRSDVFSANTFSIPKDYSAEPDPITQKAR